MKILVTGGGGFLGSVVVRALAGRHEVVSLDHGRHYDALKKKIPMGVDWKRGDILDEAAVAEALQGVEAVIHTAGTVGERRCKADPAVSERMNVAGTEILVRAAVRQKVKRVFYTSTYWVYSTYTPRPLPIPEDSELMTDSLYGEQKARSEKMIRESGLPHAIFRIAALYGYGTGVGSQWENLIGKFVLAAFEGRPLTIFGDGLQKIDFVCVDDAARVMADLLDRPGGGSRIFNLGGGRAVSVMEAARAFSEEMRKSTGRTIEIRTEPAPPGKVWPDKWLSVDRLRGFFPSYPFTPLEEGIRRTIEDYRVARAA